MFQTIIVAGNVGRDPEMRYTPSGQAVTSFSLATNRSYTNSSGQTTKETIWFRVSCWGKLAEQANNYVKKGNKVLIEGRLVADPATGGPRIFTRNDGSAGTSFEINASVLRFLNSRSESESGSSSNSGSSNSNGVGYQEYSEPTDEEDIPF